MSVLDLIVLLVVCLVHLWHPFPWGLLITALVALIITRLLKGERL